MNAVFTIVSQNYLPLAFTLGESVKLYHPDVHFSILLADKPLDETEKSTIEYNIDTLNVLDISDIDDLLFKYNVTEFCTAVKPYYFDHLLNKGYNKVIYFDPDVCVFSSLDEIFNELESYSMVLTPHLLTPEIKFNATISEALLLYAGVYNLGFAAVSNTNTGRFIVTWWKTRLHDKCFADKMEALHTDQKWIDLVPAFFGDNILISRDYGRNMAIWNLSERCLIDTDEVAIYLNERTTKEKFKLMFFHFAGYDIDRCETVIHKNHPEFTTGDFPEIKGLLIGYRKSLKKNHYDQFINRVYGYQTFDDGSLINIFQRRLFRRLIEDGNVFTTPFLTGENTFYNLLKKNGLLSTDRSLDKMNERNMGEFNNKLKILNNVMVLVKRIFGFDRYVLLLKFCQRYFRPENQTFLFSEYKREFTFINENRKYDKVPINK